jgi:dTDP-4-dehydrorhamnose reductase
MKLLVIGGSGLLGYRIVELAAKKHETFFTYNYRPVKIGDATGLKLDKCDREETSKAIEKVRPDVVIDTAAQHNVDYCETHKEEAWKINVEGTRNVVDGCKQIGARMIFLSTDYVFDGTKGSYNEQDQLNPINYYGKTKLEAENVVKNAGIRFAITRTSVIYGWNPNEIAGLKSSSGKSVNFVIWALRKLRAGEEIKAVTDQYSSPTLADNLAEVLLTMASSDEQGVYHTAGTSCLNRYDFTLKIARIFGFDNTLVKPVTSEAFKQAAQRPMRCCLDVSKTERAFNVKLLDAETGLHVIKTQAKDFGW